MTGKSENAAYEAERKRLLLYLKSLLKVNPKASLAATIDLIETTKPADFDQHLHWLGAAIWFVIGYGVAVIVGIIMRWLSS